MTPQAADALLFADALACELAVPAEFVALAPAEPQRHQQHAAAVLAALAQIEDARRDGDDEHDESPAAARRLEAKLDLLLGLFGRLLREREGAPPARALRWSTRGARLRQRVDAAPGASGLLRLQAAAWLPETLELPAQVLAAGDEAVWLRFAPAPAELADALERHLFRLHRREIAQARRPRRSP
ncbi:PilZ domain-containing protein [Vulcaniibacterium tengchongense]|uniref:Atypical PilZ domain-containing cyclic di-GMP receptor n=1 Tax=Vulcaniibacterium tengchongense TaxID=1273429 RepID=A0A3N4W476_9GAMM|nr:PilZ domain-containing protein [Vulcaniibacterium tengchongense]RPE80870.1 atypical PilZ domain-containing cyclic di-GMP receptor [Vulcaniibacterium tengchongense]